ncbi:MAG TPA: prevent-host-death protein [Cyanobacteria bacterium UBA8803]|nr:prevent-host-death protein [Cyanobacteria bacterium UBA9273]HBL59822.1 prevent-host-death protein [Cyanobacteria bacterium UBA8803]
MDWKIEEAQHQFLEVINAAEQTPQLIYDHNHLVVAVVRADLFQEFLAWQQKQPALADVFTELHQLCLEENYTFESVPRRDRPNPFAEMFT